MKAVNLQGKGSVLATKAAETQGKGSAFAPPPPPPSPPPAPRWRARSSSPPPSAAPPPARGRTEPEDRRSIRATHVCPRGGEARAVEASRSARGQGATEGAAVGKVHLGLRNLELCVRVLARLPRAFSGQTVLLGLLHAQPRLKNTRKLTTRTLGKARGSSGNQIQYVTQRDVTYWVCGCFLPPPAPVPPASSPRSPPRAPGSHPSAPNAIRGDEGFECNPR